MKISPFILSSLKNKPTFGLKQEKKINQTSHFIQAPDGYMYFCFSFIGKPATLSLYDAGI